MSGPRFDGEHPNKTGGRRGIDGTHAKKLSKLAEARRQADDELALVVDAARTAGVAWHIIGAALGVSRQAVQQRYGRNPSGPLEAL